MMKDTFQFIFKALFVLKIFEFLPWHFGIVEKRLDQKDKFHFKNFDVTTWLTNNYNTQYTYCPISQEVKATGH